MMDNDELVDWLGQIAAYQDGSLSDDEFASFDEHLQTDAEKRELFVAVQEQSVAITEVTRSRAVTEVTRSFDDDWGSPRGLSANGLAGPSGFRFLRRRRNIWLLSSVGIAASLLLAFFLWHGKGDQGSTVAERSDAIGTVTYDDQAAWRNETEQRTISELAHLSRATQYTLQSGITRIKMSGGAVVSMSAPASFTLLSPSEMRLDSGKMAFRLPNDQSDLTVRVGNFNVRDLGTSFGVTAEKDGRVDVAVFDGEISVSGNSESADPSSTVFAKGEAFSVVGNDLLSEAADDSQSNFDPESYQDIWPLTIGVNELSNVIEFVVPGGRTPVGELKDDHKLFLVPEKLGVRLSDPIEMSLTQPGQTWPQSIPAKADLPGERSIHSYLLVYQPKTSRFAKGVALSGSVEFEQPIVGVAATRTQLRATDRPFGLDSINYSSFGHRRLEGSQSERSELPADTISIDEDGHRLFFHLHVGAGRDHLRVLVRGD